MSHYRAKSTLEQWRIFQAVIDCGGYAHAADALNKSQSSLNHAVAKLQQVLGVTLLQVKGRKAELTPIGKVMLRRSRQLTQTAQELEQLAYNLEQGWEPEVKLALEMAFDRASITSALKQFQKLSRGSRLSIEDTVLTGTLEHIEEQTADVVITHHLPKGHIGEPIDDYYMDLVCAPDHPLANLPQPVKQDQLSQHLQLVIRDTADNPKEDEGWLRAEQRWTVSHFDEALRLVRSGLGFCWLPPYIAEREMQKGNLRKLQLDGSSCRRGSLYLVLPKGEQTGPCARVLADLIIGQPVSAISA
ncbi:LysR family transcriptional regulator [Idiomarina seosinensis]|uniref:LysR family transcriptional regulator n=1 Tax=Idiomarina seosinensis TaxID=281739 RepID=UPI00385050A0